MLHGIVREVLAGLFPEEGFVFGDQLFPATGRHGGVFLDSQPILHRTETVLEILLGHFHDDCRVHLDEPAISVVGKALILRDCGQAGHGAIVQSEIQDGFHHTGHGARGTGANADEKRVLGIAEFFLCDPFEFCDVVSDLLSQFRRILLAVLVKEIAGFGRNGEACGNRQADLGHFGESGAFASKEIAPGPIAFGFACPKRINPFFHCVPR